MPTVCELKKQAKERGLRGYSKMKKADLEKLLSGADKAKKAASESKKPKPKSPPKPKPKSPPKSPQQADPSIAIPLPPPPSKGKKRKPKKPTKKELINLEKLKKATEIAKQEQEFQKKKEKYVDFIRNAFKEGYDMLNISENSHYKNPVEKMSEYLRLRGMNEPDFPLDVMFGRYTSGSDAGTILGAVTKDDKYTMIKMKNVGKKEILKKVKALQDYNTINKNKYLLVKNYTGKYGIHQDD